jgi:hypothetical protein
MINLTNNSERFNISQQTITTTGQALLTAVNGSIERGGEFGMYDQPRHGFQDRLRNASRDGDLPKTFDQITEAMTNVTRNYGTNPHLGDTYESVQYFDVQWLVLILPGLIFFTSYLFFVLTLFDTRLIGKATWKESILPMLLYGFEEDTRLLLKEAADQGPTELDDATDRYVVFYDKEKECLELCTHVQPVRFRTRKACLNCQTKAGVQLNIQSSPT